MVPFCHSQVLPGLSWQELHWQLLLQTFCEHWSQLPALVAPGAHTPWPPQPLQEPQVQLEVQLRVFVPQLPQPWLSLAPAAQTPWPVQELQDPQAQLDVQVRVFVPQLPQPSL